MSISKEQIMKEIVENAMELPTIETRGSDELDFHDVAIWRIKEALHLAYEAGKESVKKD